MKHLIAVAAIFTLGAAAQEPGVSHITIDRPASIMGTPVKGAPYSADEITESLQVLADGTRISNQSQVAVYRDGEGRVRRETPSEITIWDPVANVSYTLHPKSMTAAKSTLGWSFTLGPSTANKVFFFSKTTTTGSGDLATAKQEAEAKAQAAGLDKMKAELMASENGRMLVNGNPADPQTTMAMKEQLDAVMEKLSKTVAENPAKSESLGQQVMQGVTAEGTRTTTTIEAGAIGNDRPIQTVSERWYSSELQTVVMTKRTDPRTGEETFRLANVHRGEPGADLFLLPPGYQLVESQTKTLTPLPARKEE